MIKEFRHKQHLLPSTRNIPLHLQQIKARTETWSQFYKKYYRKDLQYIINQQSELKLPDLNIQKVHSPTTHLNLRSKKPLGVNLSQMSVKIPNLHKHYNTLNEESNKLKQSLGGINQPKTRGKELITSNSQVMASLSDNSSGGNYSTTFYEHKSSPKFYK